MKWLIILLMASSMPVVADDCVVLLHGLARSSNSMNKLAGALQDAGYQTVNHDYPSTKHDLKTLAEHALQTAIDHCPSNATIHIVTHSMGGILVRQYLSANNIANLGRVVMLAPPNGGSQVVDKLAKMPGFKWVNGEAGLQLGTDEQSAPLQLGEVDFDLGVIAGTRTVNPILSTMLPNPDDGKVSVANTKITGMNDHIQMPVTHTFMMRNKKVIEQVIYYLQNGKFRRE